MPCLRCWAFWSNVNGSALMAAVLTHCSAACSNFLQSDCTYDRKTLTVSLVTRLLGGSSTSPASAWKCMNTLVERAQWPDERSAHAKMARNPPGLRG